MRAVAPVSGATAREMSFTAEKSEGHSCQRPLFVGTLRCICSAKAELDRHSFRGTSLKHSFAIAYLQHKLMSGNPLAILNARQQCIIVHIQCTSLQQNLSHQSLPIRQSRQSSHRQQAQAPAIGDADCLKRGSERLDTLSLAGPLGSGVAP